MEKKTDLRVIKTKRRIKEVFCELLKKKDVNQISVAELARIAEINKGTFYLHYQDIYALYAEILQDKVQEEVNSVTFFHEFFEAPEDFLQHFYELRRGHFQPMGNPIFKPVNVSHAHLIPEMMIGALREKIYEQGRIEQSNANDTKLNYILFSIFHFLRTKDPEENLPILIPLIAGDIRAAFPNVIINK